VLCMSHKRFQLTWGSDWGCMYLTRTCNKQQNYVLCDCTGRRASLQSACAHACCAPWHMHEISAGAQQAMHKLHRPTAFSGSSSNACTPRKITTAASSIGSGLQVMDGQPWMQHAGSPAVQRSLKVVKQADGLIQALTTSKADWIVFVSRLAGWLDPCSPLFLHAMMISAV